MKVRVSGVLTSTSMASAAGLIRPLATLMTASAAKVTQQQSGERKQFQHFARQQGAPPAPGVGQPTSVEPRHELHRDQRHQQQTG